MKFVMLQCPKCGRTGTVTYCKDCRKPTRRVEIEQLTLGLFEDDEEAVQSDRTRPNLRVIDGGRGSS